MFLKENILLAVSGLKSNKARAFLTMLGIIIGIGSVIAIVSIGSAVTAKVSDSMTSMGVNSVYVYVAKRSDDSATALMSADTGAAKIDDEDLVTDEQIQTIQKRFSDDIDSIAVWNSPNSSNGKVEKGHDYANIEIEGVNPGFCSVENKTMLSGRFVQQKDIEANRRVAVVSDKLVGNIFRNSAASPLGKEINVNTDDGTDSYTVVGVYKYEQQGMMTGNASGKDIRTSMYIPISVVNEAAENKNYSSFEVKPKQLADTAVLTQKLQKYMQRLYANNSKYTCDAYNEENMLTQVTSVMGTLSIAIAAIAAIALLVGGVGVMNIMLVSVTERTREIGTRKALGARSGYIRMQFIVEAVIICLIGGIVGIIVGLLLALVGDSLLSMRFIVSVPTIFVSVAFSMLIGVFFGYYPAKKASRLDPIDALRYE